MPADDVRAVEFNGEGRLGPGLLIAGAGVLLYRTIALIVGAATVLKRWVIGLTVVEMIIDATTMAKAARWWRTGDPHDGQAAMRVGTAATLLHAGRVAVFVAGRFGPWKDFDVRPGQRAGHDARWTWPQVAFAGAMSVIGVVGAAVLWRIRRSPADDGARSATVNG
ncbi:MAG: hypothetical protein HKN26_00580 [Acidimicrobiales bacterium]|nr:hypothetical protein [Acidimicrobiales bacterium]